MAFFAPRWAVERAVPTNFPDRHRWKPDPEQFAQFAEAVARRYSGGHRDPARSGQRLPAVRLWTTWNEPNHGAFLLPQWRRSGGTWIPQSPHIYRELHERGYAAIKGVNPQNQVLLGGTAALGGHGRGRRKAIPPLQFLRELACVDRRGRPLERSRMRRASSRCRPTAGRTTRTRSTTARTCRASTRTMSRWATSSACRACSTRLHSTRPDHDPASDLPDRVRLRDEPAGRRCAASRSSSRRATTASRPISRGSSRTSRCSRSSCSTTSPRRRARSNDPIEASRDWHSGLYFHDGRPKEPAVQAFKIPFWAEARSLAGQDVVVLFGQVRPSDGPQADGGPDARPRRHVDPDPDLRDACGGRPDVRRGRDVVPDRHRGLLPARRALPGAGHLPRALDQDRRDLRVRRDDPGARACSAATD